MPRGANPRPGRPGLALLGVLATAGCTSTEPEPPEASYPGDELALAPPSAGEGFQLHFGPGDPDDPAEVQPFVFEPGEEGVDCLYGQAPNESEAFISGYEASLRPGTHHLLVNPADAAAPPGELTDCAFADPNELYMLLQGGVGPDGARLEYSPAAAPENEGLARRLGPREMLGMQRHFVNTTEHPLLGEAWVNLEFVEKDAVRILADGFTLYAGLKMSIPPHTREIVRGECTGPDGASGPVRVLDLFGHMHAHGRRISAWHVTTLPSGTAERTLVYETYAWAELERYSFDSVTQNPAPSAALRTGGGASGPLILNPGDRIAFECEFDNTEDFALEFAAATYTAEMCGLIGNYAPSAGKLWFCGID